MSRGVIVRFNSEISSLTLDRLATVSGPLSVRENPQLEVIKMGSLGTVRGGITVRRTCTAPRHSIRDPTPHT